MREIDIVNQVYFLHCRIAYGSTMYIDLFCGFRYANYCTMYIVYWGFGYANYPMSNFCFSWERAVLPCVW